MKIDGKAYRTIWRAGAASVETIDQTRLPHELAFRRLDSLEGAVEAIKTMVVRGAPLIGATAAYGLAIALTRAGDDAALEDAYRDAARQPPDGRQSEARARRRARGRRAASCSPSAARRRSRARTRSARRTSS